MATDPGIPKVEAAPGGSGDASSEGRRGSDPPRLDLKKARKERICTAKERISRMPPCAAGKRSSIYRGVTRAYKFTFVDYNRIHELVPFSDCKSI
ncbi:hypothetical protein ZIOFF_076009 [Zingiber officinale]|uniref:Uncharacterized protein n=1 Tax=Zingiber officinale TaxID=94328 RepID=A0A8J5C3S3_ZINOF|nr:hypothetical protein ZIOFF_076009 [Zingiber officinale]